MSLAVYLGPMGDALAWVVSVGASAALRLGMSEPLRFPAVLIDLCAAGIDELVLDEARLPKGPLAEPDPGFGLLGPDMTDYFDSYEFAVYMPGAWPVALDGGGGFFCLDLRDVAGGQAANDGSAPIVWAHAGNLGWGENEAARMGDDLQSFLAAVDAQPPYGRSV